MEPTDHLVEQVRQAIEETAAAVVLPRFRSPTAQARQKGPGDWVTVADHDAEAQLARLLPALLPGSSVVGEEAVHAAPAVLEELSADRPVWLVDPLDGTANFAAGREPFAMMVALLRQGRTELGWIYLPMRRATLSATRGKAAHLDGVRVPPRQAAGSARAILPLPALPAEIAASIERRAQGVLEVQPSVWCAGSEYHQLLSGAADAALFTATMPWDHAAGVLALTAAGGRAAYLDGSPYDPRDRTHRAMLVAVSPGLWEKVRAEVLAPDL